MEEFAQSQITELYGLLPNGTFIQGKKEEIPAGTWILGSIFVYKLERAGKGTRMKGRLVAQNYADEQAL